MGGEVDFEWKGAEYSVSHTAQFHSKILIGEANNDETDLLADTADEILEYMIDGKRLRDIITQVKVLFRTI